MKRYNLVSLAIFSIVPLLVFAGPAWAENSEGSIRGLQFATRDLVFKVEDMGGKVQSLMIKETATEVRIELAADVLFNFDQAALMPKARAELKQAAKLIRAKAKGTVRIDGYTDAKGSAAYNQKLSKQRANAVKNWFVEREGLQEVNFATQGLGASNPVAPNANPDGSDNPEGRRQNRRVEITLRKRP